MTETNDKLNAQGVPRAKSGNGSWVAVLIALAAVLAALVLLFLRYSQTRTDLDKREAAFRELERNFEQREKHASSLDRERQEAIGGLQEQLQQEQSKATRLQAELAASQQELQEKTKRLTAGESGLFEARAEADRLRLEIEKRVRALTEQLDGSLRNLSLVQDRLRAAEADLTRSQGEERLLRGRIRELENEKEAAGANWAREMSQLREAMAQLKEQVANGDAKKARLAGELAAARSTIRVLEEERDLATSQLGEAREQLRDALGGKKRLEVEIRELRATFERLVVELKGEIENREVTIHEYEGKLSITFVDRVLFEFGSARLTSEGKHILARIGGILSGFRERRIQVVGHTDDRPIKREFAWRFPSNWELSSARSSAVIQYLMDMTNLDPASLEAVGRAFYDPIADNDTVEGRAKNRRVEIIVAPILE
jgi:flagellar motor protein MotB